MTELSLFLFVLYGLSGIFIGFIAGFFGIGGGSLIVPLLIFSFAWQQFSPHIAVHLAIGTSLACIVVTALSATRTHHRAGGVRWECMARLTPGLIVGAVLGAWVVNDISGELLKQLFAVFLLLVALQLVIDWRPQMIRQHLVNRGMLGFGALAGCISAFFGIGGGVLIAPYLMWCGLNARQAIGTAASCGFPIAVFGSVTYMIVGWGNAHLPQWSSGYIYWPAVGGIAVGSIITSHFGAQWVYRMHDKTLKILFALLLVAVGIYLLW